MKMLSNIFAGKVDGVKEISRDIEEKTIIDNFSGFIKFYCKPD